MPPIKAAKPAEPPKGLSPATRELLEGRRELREWLETRAKCVACQGTGKSSRGWTCPICQGTGGRLEP